MAMSTRFIIKWRACNLKLSTPPKRGGIHEVFVSFFKEQNAKAKKRAAFCIYIGSKTFTLLCSLHPGKPEDRTYETFKES